MIETTYVKLEKAAEMLETDRDTLLLAAIEGRISLYAVFGHSVWAIGPDYTADDFYMEQELFLESGLQDQVKRSRVYVCHVMLERDETIQLLREGRCRPSTFESQTYFPEAYQDVIWAIDDDETPEVSIQDVLIKRVDVENIKANSHLSEPDTVPAPRPKRKGAETKVYNNQHRIIGGLLELITAGTDEHGKSISTYTTQEQIIGYLEDQYPDAPGLGKSHLENTFADAKRALREIRNPK